MSDIENLQKKLDWAYKNLELMTVENMTKEIQRLQNKDYENKDIEENQNILKSHIYYDLENLEDNIKYLKKLLLEGFKKLEPENIDDDCGYMGSDYPSGSMGYDR